MYNVGVEGYNEHTKDPIMQNVRYAILNQNRNLIDWL